MMKVDNVYSEFWITVVMEDGTKYVTDYLHTKWFKHNPETEDLDAISVIDEVGVRLAVGDYIKEYRND